MIPSRPTFELTNDYIIGTPFRFTVSGLVPGGSWQYSLNWGRTWTNGKQPTFSAPFANYGTGQIQVRQRNSAGQWNDTIIGTPARENFTFGNLLSSTLSGFYTIRGFEKTDFISVRGNYYGRVLTKTIGHLRSFTEKSVSALLSPSKFPTGGAVAFTASGFNGTFVALDNRVPGFQVYRDSIIFLGGHKIDSTNPISVL